MNIFKQVLRNLIHIRDVEIYCNITSNFEEKLTIFKRNKVLFKKFISSKDKDINIRFKYNNHIISIFMYSNTDVIYVRAFFDTDGIEDHIKLLDIRADNVSGKLIYFDCNNAYLNSIDKILNILLCKISVEEEYTEEITRCLDKLPTSDLESLKEVNMIYDRI